MWNFCSVLRRRNRCSIPPFNFQSIPPSSPYGYKILIISSCHFPTSPNQIRPLYIISLPTLSDPVLICGDFNAKSPMPSRNPAGISRASRTYTQLSNFQSRAQRARINIEIFCWQNWYFAIVWIRKESLSSLIKELKVRLLEFLRGDEIRCANEFFARKNCSKFVCCKI